MTVDERHALLLILAIGVLAPLLADRVAARLRVPAVVLEVGLGIVVGPHVLGWAAPGPAVDVFATFGLLLLFFLAGFEIDFREIAGTPLRRAVPAWGFSVLLALAIGAVLERTGVVLSATVLSLATTTTAIGTLMPMLRDAGELRTPFGRQVLAAGVVGEFGPIVMMALVLEGGDVVHTLATLGAFVAIALAAGWLATREHPGHLVAVFRRLTHTSAQLPLRASLLVLGLLVFVTGQLALDAVLGAMVAGIVVALAVAETDAGTLLAKLEGLGFGFFIPIFFVVSGMRFDLTALLASPSSVLRVPLFLSLFLVVRGLPAVLHRGDLAPGDRLPFALLTATQLPLVVAITSVAVRAGRMLPENAAALVGAAMLSVFLFPLTALALRAKRSGVAEPAAVADAG
jgi:Kef-type K+ transport system membrane component KefB